MGVRGNGRAGEHIRMGLGSVVISYELMGSRQHKNANFYLVMQVFWT